MRIRTQFIIGMAVFGGVLLTISASVIATSQDVGRLAEQQEIAISIERGADDLSYLLNDYLLYREDQQRSRWESRFASFARDLSSLKLASMEQQALADDMKASQRMLKAVFTDVAATVEEGSQSADASIVHASVQVSWSRMVVQIQGIAFDALLLSRMLQDQMDELRQRNAALVFALLGVFGAYLLANYFVVYRRALRAISELQAGTAIVGAGNLDFAIKVKHDDEIGELSRAFNRMTASLKHVTASKAELEREIAERRKAEAERERLLGEVLAQAEQLQSQNEELQAQNEEIQSQAEEHQAQNEEIQSQAEELQAQNERLRAQEAERERLLQAEQEARAEADVAVKAREEFISIAAHELKTPVTSLLGFAQLMQRDLRKTGTVDPARLAMAMERIDLQSRRLAKLTDQLLNVSRLQSGKLTLLREEVCLSTLTRRLIADFQEAHPGRAIELRDGAAGPAFVDPMRVEQVLVNLMENAVKFSPDGQSIVIDLDGNEFGWVRIAVEDRGIGIAEDQRERIFERFYQAHPASHHGGMGIGLFVSREIVEMHGGSIAVEQPEEGGSRFVVRLPLDSAASGCQAGRST